MLVTKSEKQWWEQERAKGYSHYLLRRGILERGLYFGSVMTVLSIAVPYFWHHPVLSIWELAVRFGFYTIGFGAWMGSWNWRCNEKDYQKPTEADDHVA